MQFSSNALKIARRHVTVSLLVKQPTFIYGSCHE